MNSTLWFGESTRYFLIPADAILPDGAFLIQTLEGEQRTVEEKPLITFEVSETEAKTHFKTNLLQALEKTKILLGLDTSKQELPKTQESLREDIQEKLKTVLIGVLNEDLAQLQSIRDQLRHLQEIIETQGLELGIDLAYFPEQIESWYALSHDEETIKAWGDQLIETAGISADPSLTAGQRIDRAIEALEKQFGDLFAYPNKAYQHEQLQKSYRQAANLDIATALKAHGITPRASSAAPSFNADSPDNET